MYSGKWLNTLSMNEFFGQPRSQKGLDPILDDLALMQYKLREEEDLTPYIEAIEKADAKTISLARLHLAFSIEMIQETMRLRDFEHGYRDHGLLRNTNNCNDIIDKILSGVEKEAAAHAKRAMFAPGDKSAIEGLASALKVSAEAMIVLQAMEQAGYLEKPEQAEKAYSVFTDISLAALKVREGVGPFHSESVLRALPHPQEILKKSNQTAANLAAISSADLTPRAPGAIFLISGTVEDAHYNYTHGIKDTRPELTEKQANKLKEDVAGMLRLYNVVFHRPGFINLIHQASVMSRWTATQTVDRETLNDVGASARQEIREDEKEVKTSLWNDFAKKRLFTLSVEDRKERLARRQKSYLEESRRNMALATSIDVFLARATRALGSYPVSRILNTESRDGHVVLRFENAHPSDPALIVYDDKRPEGAYADRVYVAVVEDGQLENGIPDLEDIRDAEWCKGTNFRNIEDFIVSLQGPEMQEYVFNSSVILNDENHLLVLERQPTENEDHDDSPSIAF